MKNMKYNMTFGIVFACVILFTTCDNFADPPEIHPPMSGYGRISINFVGEEAEQQARTVFPSTTFNRYEYTFTKAGETTGVVKTPNSDGFFTLEVGNYTVAVRAFIGNATTPAANGVSPQFNVGPGNNDPVTVRLTGVAATGRGVLSYTITYPAGAEAVITLQKWPDLNDITLNPLNTTQGNGKTQMLELDAGFYLLTILVSKTPLYAGISETVHIYQSLTTVYAKAYVDSDLINAIPPTANDYTISGTGTFTYDGSAKTANITRKENASTGAITVSYNGTTTAPVDAGTYNVTFNVAVARGFSQATGLPAGTITINIASGAAVSAPTGTSSVTSNSITINAVTAPENGQTVEYAKNTTNTAPSSDWQAGTTFSGLTDGTTYYIFARAVENKNYETGAASGSLSVTTLQTVSPDRIEYYWVDQHGSLVTTSGGATTVASGATLTITAQEDGYDVKLWYLNGKSTGQSGNTYDFSSTTAGNHTVVLFVEKDGKLYNTSITIMVDVFYTITFDANDGSGTVPSAQIVKADSSITLPSGSGLTMSGYTFGGWNTSADGTGSNYSAGASYTPTDNITLYARWLNGSEANPFPLTAGVWTDGSVPSSTSAVWYSFNVTIGTTYYIWWNDSYQGNSTKTSIVQVSASYSTGTSIFSGAYGGWSSSRTFTASSSGTVKIKVEPYSNTSGYTGTFAVAYRTTSTRP